MSDFLYAVGGTLAGVGIIVGTAIISASKAGEGATVRDRILSSPFLTPMLIFHYFLPYGLVALVLFMDIMSQLPQGVVGFGAATLMFWMNYLVGNDKTQLPSELCEIPGLQGMSSSFVPQSILFVSVMVSYLAAFVTASGRNSLAQSSGNSATDNLMAITSSGTVSTSSPSQDTRIGASWGLALATVLLQVIGILSSPTCLTNMKVPMLNTPLPAWASALLAVVIGFGVGGGTGTVMANQSFTQPSYTVTTTAGATPTVTPGLLPTTPSTQAKGPGFVREQFQLGSGLGEMPMPAQGGQMAVDMAKSSGAVTPGDSSDQFVCEAYKNGQLVSSTLT